ncbi:protein FAR1-RELATED SEQUENCE 11 isoform X2 [Phalaenopsis equestris]|uniref:protein FAR1-RELATED SEQUENCE 11 isoform X2 n=1 Tax=Phalaenopsis equestris TaxID=78828 RepID=UPI0009E4D39D|nr:protein FAR1-RELATED SEQUENCE 11 isoform X2 [Phalaenopsis equestris]
MLCLKMTEEANAMLDVFDEQSQQRSFSLDDSSGTEESPQHISLETPNDAIPYIGQRFSTHDAAYDFYSHFAKGCGFSIRRHRTEGKDGVGKGITRRYFVCHRAGNTPIKVSSKTKPQRNRKSSRCGCQAYMRISRCTEMGLSEWHVTGFAINHNHELLEPNLVRFLPAYRTISDVDKNRILMFSKTGISVQQMMRLMELEKCVEPGYLPFTEKDVRNLIQSFRRVEQDDENLDLLRMCRNHKEKDPSFRYEFTTDVNGRLENISWSYASAVQSYEIFGDAVVFDTTHRLNAFDMPLGIWVGMNNYGIPCFFGCVLLREENVHAFSWALKVFLKFMNGKAPQTLMTDQNMCLREAIGIEMPTTKHAFCMWHIVAKFPSCFNAVLGDRYNDWKRMTTPGVSKAVNALIQRFLNAQTRLPHFFEQAAVAVDFKDQAAEQQTMQQNLQNICVKTGAPMEAHAAAILTPYAFCKLQDEFVMAAHYASFQVEESCFLVRHHTKMDGGRKVYWDSREEFLSCSCHMFEFSGILCRHALRVLSTINFFQIPERYLPLRWRRVNSLQSKPSLGEDEVPVEQNERFQALQSMISSLVSEATRSKERLDIACEEISQLLYRIRGVPPFGIGLRNGVHRAAR